MLKSITWQSWATPAFGGQDLIPGSVTSFFSSNQVKITVGLLVATILQLFPPKRFLTKYVRNICWRPVEDIWLFLSKICAYYLNMGGTNMTLVKAVCSQILTTIILVIKKKNYIKCSRSINIDTLQQQWNNSRVFAQLKLTLFQNIRSRRNATLTSMASWGDRKKPHLISYIGDPVDPCRDKRSWRARQRRLLIIRTVINETGGARQMDRQENWETSVLTAQQAEKLQKDGKRKSSQMWREGFCYSPEGSQTRRWKKYL